LDCWRYYPDGLRALAKWGKFEVLEATTQWEKQNYKIDDSDLWMDSMLVGKKLSTEENLQQITTFLNNWINKNKNKSDHWVEGNYENNHETTNYNYLNSLPYEERARLTLLSIYRQRKDLQVHYPEANNGINLSNLICWAKNYGIKEVPQLTLYSDFYEKNCK
jgi:hypothetical protein